VQNSPVCPQNSPVCPQNSHVFPQNSQYIRQTACTPAKHPKSTKGVLAAPQCSA